MLLERNLCVVLSGLVNHDVNKDAEDQRTSNACDGNLTEGKGQTADTGNQDNGNGKEVCVLLKVNVLDHLETGNRDESVQSHTNAAHNT